MQRSMTSGSYSYRMAEGELLLTIIALVAVIGSISILTVTGPHTFTGMASALENSSSTNVSLTVNEQTIVSVEPALYNFSGMTLGSTNFSDVPALQLIIRNDGSNNITDIYASPDTLQSEQDNPLGTGQAKEYASGRFLWLKNDTSRWYHAGTITWNRTENAGGTPSGIGGERDNGVSYGFYRNATGDYLWELSANGTSGGHDGTCNTDNTGSWEPPVLRIKDVKDDGSNRDLSATDTIDYQLSTNNTDWSATQATEGPLNGHYIASHSTCEKLYIYRFDATDTFPLNGEDAQYLNNETMAPGDEFNSRVGAAVPQGIPAGTTNQTILTITASSTS